MAEKEKKGDAQKIESAQDMYKRGGLSALLEQIGITARQAAREAQELIAAEGADPDAQAVLAAWDEAGGMENADAALDAALGVAGLTRADLAPGEKPWHYRESPRTLILILRDGRRLEFED